MTAPQNPLVEKVGDAIRQSIADNRGKLQPETVARAALDACHAEELASVLREYIAAADDCVTGDDDIAAMLRFGAADKAARALLAKLGEAV